MMLKVLIALLLCALGFALVSYVSIVDIAPIVDVAPSVDVAPIVALPDSGYWLEEEPDEATAGAALWRFDSAVPEDWTEEDYILSVSPSGQALLAAKRDLRQNSRSGNPGNRLGREAAYISLYELRDGRFEQTGRIPIDPEADPDWNDVVVNCDELNVAWSPDESLLLLATGIVDNISSILSMIDSAKDYNVYLVDFAEESVVDLMKTGDNPASSDSTYFHCMPQWADHRTIRFIRYELDASHMLLVSLMGIDIVTGEQTLLADLSVEGRLAIVCDYVVRGDAVYYSIDAMVREVEGFYATKLGDNGRLPACLLSIADLREKYGYPYAMELWSVQISPDGRWACLTIRDQRVLTRDFPFADHPDYPQSDPGAAVSTVLRGREWVPYHDVILYDLRYHVIVNPFTAGALQPDVAIAISAAFAPDGRSLLCAVLGDGGVWTMDGLFSETTVYQIRLDDASSFHAARVYKTDVHSPPNMITWLKGNTLWIRPAWYSSPRVVQTILVKPAAFEGMPMDE